METIKERIEDIINRKSNTEYPDFPRRNLLIEVTNHCNNKCIFCANKTMTRKRRFIDKSTLEKALIECFELGMKEIGFYATGEPLLNENLEEYILLAKNIGYEYIYLTTNGILATKERLKKFFDNGLNSIKFSINAIGKEAYKKVHGTDYFEKVIENLREAYKLKLEKYNNVKISVSYMMVKRNLEPQAKIKKFFNDISDEVIIDLAKNQGGLIKEIDNLIDNVSNIKLPCFYVFNSVNITCEGYITACCMDFQNYLAYANINEISISEAWKCETITNLRRKHLNKNVEGTICDNCIKCVFNKIEPIDKSLATYIDN